MKNIYFDQKFAEYWDKRSGNQGDSYKRYVTNPITLRMFGNLKGKTILEIGCGNGYFGKKMLDKGAKKVILSDASPNNLKFARARIQNPRAEFLQQDCTKKWKIPSSSIDIVYAAMVFNEVANIKTPIREAYRVLKSGGQLIFSVTHPGWDLYEFAREKAGFKSEKLKGLKGYFSRGFISYQMGVNNAEESGVKQYKGQIFSVAHYQRPVSDYVNALIESGFHIQKMVEPQMTRTILKKKPSVRSYTDHPVSLILNAKKIR